MYNYGQQNYGTLSIADAIAVSSNTGFVRLSYVDSEKSGVTPESIVAMQERLGLRGGKLVNYPTADKLPAVATTTLGVGQANTTEMASAFGTFAAEGVHHDATAILTVTDRNGNELVNNTNQKGEQVLSKSVAYAVTQTLEGVIYKSMGTASAAALSSGQIAAGKTGTTDNWHDLWFVGYTPQLSCAVWTGDRSNQLELYTDSWCQEIWRYVMEHALEGVPNQNLLLPPSPIIQTPSEAHPLRKKMRKTKRRGRMRTRSPVILPTAAPPIRPRTNRATTTPRAIRERPAPRLAPRPTPPPTGPRADA
ncbi:MAG: penicillin-binding transpeptidase domain-containing protein [Slackia sp.]